MSEDTLAVIISNIDSDKTLEALSQAAEVAERYEDMVEIMKAIVNKKLAAEESLSSDMRNMLSVAYKNVVGAKRSSWRILSEDMQMEVKAEIIENYKKQVESELQTTCQEVLDLLVKLSDQNEARIGKAPDEEKAELNECQIFYLKMIGDYYRYLTEAFKSNAENCHKYYNMAMELAKEHLEATHPTRLGLALNFSVCHYEILEQPKEACALAKAAFDEAIEKLDSLNDSSYKDSTLIMQLLRDNLTIWNQNEEAQDDGVEQ